MTTVFILEKKKADGKNEVIGIATSDGDARIMRRTFCLCRDVPVYDVHIREVPVGIIL